MCCSAGTFTGEKVVGEEQREYSLGGKGKKKTQFFATEELSKSNCSFTQDDTKEEIVLWLF